MQPSPHPLLSKTNQRELLIVRQYRVELYGSGADRGTWELVKKGSPGNLQMFEEHLFKNHDVESSTIIDKLMNSAVAAAGRRRYGSARGVAAVAISEN